MILPSTPRQPWSPLLYHTQRPPVFLKGAVSVVQTSANVVDALSVWVGCFHESHPLATVSRPSGLCHVIDWKSQVPLFLHISDVTWVLTNGKSTQRTHQLGTSVVGKLFFLPHPMTSACFWIHKFKHLQTLFGFTSAAFLVSTSPLLKELRAHSESSGSWFSGLANHLQ